MEHVDIVERTEHVKHVDIVDFMRQVEEERWLPDSKMAKNGQNRKDIHPGIAVEIVLKKDQPTGKLTRGIVKDILTKSPVHPRGIKVRLQDGQIGRVQVIHDDKENL